MSREAISAALRLGEVPELRFTDDRLLMEQERVIHTKSMERAA